MSRRDDAGARRPPAADDELTSFVGGFLEPPRPGNRTVKDERLAFLTGFFVPARPTAAGERPPPAPSPSTSSRSPAGPPTVSPVDPSVVLPTRAQDEATRTDAPGLQPTLFPSSISGPPFEPVASSRQIQGDILAGFRKDHVELMCLRFDDPRRARQWLAALTPFISSTAEVHTFNEQFRKARRSRGGDDPVGLKATWTNVSFTYPGIVALQPGLGGSLQQFEAFRQGPAARAALLGDIGDSAPTAWVMGGPSGLDVHAMLLVAGDDVDDLNSEVSRMRTLVARHAIGVVFAQRGDTLPGRRRGHEHFGFKDGLSQPGIQGLIPAAPHAGHRLDAPIAPGEFVLGRESEPGSPTIAVPDWMRDGSFQVVRRLAQDVPSWWAQLPRLVATATSSMPATDMLAAKLLGRWRSGAPLARYPEHDPGAARDPVYDNEFDYSDDPLGYKTPRFCHVRKMSPRDRRFGDRGRRILRRGIPYGPHFDPALGAGHGLDLERGLLFIAYMASIEHQFEFLQRSWANQPLFPGTVDHTQPLDDGPDPIIGAGDGLLCRLRQSEQPDVQLDLTRFVSTTGALYGFVPSLNTLAMLAGGRP